MPLRLNLCESSSSSEEEEINLEMQNRRRKIYRDRINFDFFLESVFIERFRLSRSAVENVLIAIGPRIDYKTNKNHALNPKQQILVALHFYGNGSQYHSIGDMHGIHKSTVCRIVNRVSRTIVRILFPKYVRWPNNCAHISGGFFNIAGFPRVAGAVDGTLIPMKTPRQIESDFVDRHGQHSINAMVVCGPNYEFFYARLGGLAPFMTIVFFVIAPCTINGKSRVKHCLVYLFINLFFRVQLLMDFLHYRLATIRKCHPSG